MKEAKKLKKAEIPGFFLNFRFIKQARKCCSGSHERSESFNVFASIAIFALRRIAGMVTARGRIIAFSQLPVVDSITTFDTF